MIWSYGENKVKIVEEQNNGVKHFKGFIINLELLERSLHSVSMECEIDKELNLKWAYIFLLYSVHVLGLNSFP